MDAGVTRAELARCAGINRAYLARIESGVGNPSLETLVALSSCLGSEVGVRMFPVAGPRLHDRFQAPMIEALIRLVGAHWRGEPEVPVPAARGVIDLVLRRPSDGSVVVCECHSELRRLEMVIRRAMEKTHAMKGLADGPADGPTNVSTLLLLRSTEATRAVARAYEATLAAAFPAKTRDAIAALAGNVAWPGAAIVWATVEGFRATIQERPPRGVRVGR
jgi:transcriptional regulator with XRE-family HTH domain